MACESFHDFRFDRSLASRGREPALPSPSRLGVLAALGGDRRADCALFAQPAR